jgi:hypothetical protein
MPVSSSKSLIVMGIESLVILPRLTQNCGVTMLKLLETTADRPVAALTGDVGT